MNKRSPLKLSRTTLRTLGDDSFLAGARGGAGGGSILGTVHPICTVGTIADVTQGAASCNEGANCQSGGGSNCLFNCGGTGTLRTRVGGIFQP
jgi:hypothetical protein